MWVVGGRKKHAWFWWKDVKERGNLKEVGIDTRKSEWLLAK
jgi:hypothetical protein